MYFVACVYKKSLKYNGVFLLWLYALVLQEVNRILEEDNEKRIVRTVEDASGYLQMFADLYRKTEIEKIKSGRQDVVNISPSGFTVSEENKEQVSHWHKTIYCYVILKL